MARIAQPLEDDRFGSGHDDAGVAEPIHGVAMLLCARDARYFDLLLLWGRTRAPAYWGNLNYWRASSYSQLTLQLAVARQRRAGSAEPACPPGLRLRGTVAAGSGEPAAKDGGCP